MSWPVYHTAISRKACRKEALQDLFQFHYHRIMLQLSCGNGNRNNYTICACGCQDDNNSSHNEESEMAEMRHFHTSNFYTVESGRVSKLIGSDPLAFIWRKSRVNWETARKTRKSLQLMWQHMLLLLLLFQEKNCDNCIIRNEEWSHIKIFYCDRWVKYYSYFMFYNITYNTDITKKA